MQDRSDGRASQNKGENSVVMRRVVISRSSNIDAEDLKLNPYVRKAWVMPWQFSLFEFYDPIHEKLDDPKSELADPTQWTDDVRKYMRGLVDAERRTLAPLYDGKARHWQGNKLGLPLRGAFYRIVDSKNLHLPWLGQSKDWEIAKILRICGKLSRPDNTALDEVLRMWESWLSSIGEAPNSESSLWTREILV
jgi:hypothetical protein